MHFQDITKKIITQFSQSTFEEFALGNQEHQNNEKNKLKFIVEDATKHLSAELKLRIHNEFFNNGPLEALLADEDVTEIIINDPDSIYIEKKGVLQKYNDHFHSAFTYEKYIDRLTDQLNTALNIDNPFIDGKFKNFRVSLTDRCITQNFTSINFRRHPLTSWNFEKLSKLHWCSSEHIDEFQKLINSRKNFLIIGSTGSGKTSVLNSFLNLTDGCERSVIIEDTLEVSLPNPSCLRLLTKESHHASQSSITQTDLVKRALRLRPDRIIMGEIRGGEAKDFLMALSTGHQGSFGTLHANDPHQALIRLEMLIQMGAPHWSLTAIRRLIFLSLDYIIISNKNTKGQRQFNGAYQLCSLEENGFLIERKF